jgi:hypothetical protein
VKKVETRKKLEGTVRDEGTWVLRDKHKEARLPPLEKKDKSVKMQVQITHPFFH